MKISPENLASDTGGNQNSPSFEDLGLRVRSVT